LGYFFGYGGSFIAPNTHLAQTGYSHHVDQCLFGLGFGLELGVKTVEDTFEAFAGFAVEDVGVGQHAVVDGVGGEIALAFRSDRTAGKLPVGL